jgi:hypothetical protein
MNQDEAMRLRLLQVLKEEIARVEAELDSFHADDLICQNKDCQHPFCPEHSLESN